MATARSGSARLGIRRDRAALSWQPAEAHNGFLDLALQLGMVGVTLSWAASPIAVWRAVAVVRRIDSVYALWPMACLTFIVVANLAETNDHGVEQHLLDPLRRDMRVADPAKTDASRVAA